MGFEAESARLGEVPALGRLGRVESRAMRFREHSRAV